MWKTMTELQRECELEKLLSIESIKKKEDKIKEGRATYSGINLSTTSLPHTTQNKKNRKGLSSLFLFPVLLRPLFVFRCYRFILCNMHERIDSDQKAYDYHLDVTRVT